MTNQLVTVTCPLSTLATIADALNSAARSAQFRADMIMHMEALHNADPKISAGIRDTIDDVKYYEEDAQTFRQAYTLADKLYMASKDVTDPKAIEYYYWAENLTEQLKQEREARALSEAVAF